MENWLEDTHAGGRALQWIGAGYHTSAAGASWDLIARQIQWTLVGQAAGMIACGASRLRRVASPLAQAAPSVVEATLGRRAVAARVLAEGAGARREPLRSLAPAQAAAQAPTIERRAVRFRLWVETNVVREPGLPALTSDIALCCAHRRK